ncbi:MAG: AI-2E family transporter [Cryomorphaceae bacterium]
MSLTEKIIKVFAGLALTALVIWILWEGRTILLYFIVASVVALIGRPLMKGLSKLKIKNHSLPAGISAMVALLVLMGLVTMVIGIFFPLIMREAQVLYGINFSDVKDSLSPAIANANQTLENLGLGEAVGMSEGAILEYVFESINFRNIPSVINSILGVFGNAVIAVFSVAFMTYFLLRDEGMLPRIALRLTPASHEGSVERIVANTRHTLTRYFVGLVIQVTAITLCVWIGLSVVGIKNALLIGFFTGLANLIPYLGPWIGASFGVIIMVSNNIGLGFSEVIMPKFYAMLLVFGAVQLIDNYVFQPVIFSNSINAHPLEIFIIILLAGALGGIPGMVAAIPTYAFIRIVLIELNREFGVLKSIKER